MFRFILGGEAFGFRVQGSERRVVLVLYVFVGVGGSTVFGPFGAS